MATNFLLPHEVEAVLAWLHHGRRRGRNYLLNTAVFRLACRCGLRSTEICNLNMGDVWTRGTQPHLFVRADRADGVQNGRAMPIWDREMLHDLARYKAFRRAQGRPADDAPFIAGLTSNAGKRLTRDLVAKRWRSLVGLALGTGRARQAPIRGGRLSYMLLASDAGRSVQSIMEELGSRDSVVTARRLRQLRTAAKEMATPGRWVEGGLGI